MTADAADETSGSPEPTVEHRTSTADSADAIQSTRWVHRLAALLVCLIWPLIWVGALVTTVDAGMSVPDWPNTYGYNLLLYPVSTWLSGPFDIFVEHGHRLLGIVVGLVAIGLLIAAWLREPRMSVILLCFGVLMLVIIQGGLGGMRVVLGDRTLAMIHGCTAPIVFAVASIAMVMTSRWWWKAVDRVPPRRLPGRGLIALAAVVTGLSYTQLVLGALLRHVQPTTTPGQFAMTTSLHVMTAFGLLLMSLATWWSVRRCGDLTLSRPGLSLVVLLGIQIGLGIATWVVNYGFPSFMDGIPGASGYVIRAKRFVDSLIVTGHVATGSLILVMATFLLVRLGRVRRVHSHPVSLA